MSRFFDWDYFVKVFPRILGSVPVTAAITLAAFGLGLILAALLAMARVYRVPVAREFAVIYVSFMRGTPILIQLLLCNLLLPGLIWGITGVNVGRIWPPIVFVVMAYALNSAAFLAEIFRSSVSGVDAGQNEAACSVGMTGLQAFIHVVFPQALRIALPAMANSLSGLLKDTSLAYSAAGVIDVMGMASASATLTFRYLEGYVGAAVIFFGLCMLLERSFSLLSRRLSHGTAAAKGA